MLSCFGGALGASANPSRDIARPAIAAPASVRKPRRGRRVAWLAVGSLQRWHMMFSCGAGDRCQRAGAGMFRGWCIDLRDRNCPAARIAWGYEVVLGHGSDGDGDVSMNAESLTLR